MTDDLPNVLLSIHPEHAEAILDGEKRWEYRRVAPARPTPYRVVLYATEPVAGAVGVCWVPCVHSGWPSTVVARTIAETPQHADDVLDYLDGCGTAHALRVVPSRRFDEPVLRGSLEAAGVAPSQNFRYLPEIDPTYAEVERVTI